MRRPPRRDHARCRLLGALLCALLASGCATLTTPASHVVPEPQPAPAAAAAQAQAEPAAPAPATAAPEEPLAPPPPAFARGRFDPEQDAQRSSLWDRIRSQWAMPELEGERVAKWERYYARQPDYVQRMVGRSARYLFHIVEEVERRGLPGELALLPFVESAFNPQAQSRARASGMWQFMPATGKDFELRQNIFRDDRRDVLASTRAALDYLQRLHQMFGDWQLALAAYNWGQGNVKRAIARNRRAGLATDYTSLRMPEETRDYVPKLQAIKNIVVQPDRLGLVLPALGDHPYFLSVQIQRDIDVALAAQLAGMTLDEFQALNPQLNKPVILAAATPHLLLPYDSANRFIQGLPLVRGALSSWTVWVAPKTLQPAAVARLVGMAEATLREVNLIPPRMLVKAGSTLLVPRGALATLDVAGHAAEHATMVLTPEGRALRRHTFKAGKKGETLATVARRYRVSAAQVAQWNNVGATARFKPGQAVLVMLAAAPTRLASAAAQRRPAKAGKVAKAGKPAPRLRVAQGAPR